MPRRWAATTNGADFGVYGGLATAIEAIEEVSLVVDIVYDKRTIWRGHASAQINRENDDAKRLKRIQEAVKKLFDRYPRK